MRRDSLVYAMAGTFFGVLIGWILGSQQAGSRAPVATAATASAPASANAPATSSAPPLDVQRASDLERSANAQPTNAAVRIQLADLYFDAERFDLAAPWYEAGLKLDPKNINASTDLGVCYYYLNQVDKALQQLDYSLSIDPKHPKTLLNQGIVRAFGKQDLAGAAASWEKVVAVAPGSEEAQRAKQALDGLKSAHPGIGGGQPAAGAGRGGSPEGR
ncbi:MAG TPA: tetratricopeptide repeat protein [Vicinamibacterales bacterium]|nr:tetratricopeptide repeat protein [Vicinamibacterales bacterium]